jgi:hypothetical protein
MESSLRIFEGDYCFSLPTGPAGKSKNHEEKKMKAKSEPSKKSKGNGSSREASGLVVSDSYDCPREQMIAEAAYYRAEQRGFTPGNEMSDWLQAEADVEGVLRTSQ